MAKKACKNRGQERGNEASDISKTQTEKFPSTTLKMDQKYEHLQYMEDLKSVYKHDRNEMQNKAQKVLKHEVYKIITKQKKSVNET